MVDSSPTSVEDLSTTKRRTMSDIQYTSEGLAGGDASCACEQHHNQHSEGFGEEFTAPALRESFAGDFVRWLQASGFDRPSVKAWRGLLRRLIEVCPEVVFTPVAELPATPEFQGAMRAFQKRKRAEISELLVMLGQRDDDCAEMFREREEFSFCEVNPGASALGTAALRVSGRLVGAASVSDRSRPLYERLRGALAEEPVVSPDVALVNLPFSVFVAHVNGDHGVETVLREAARLAADACALLFRVDWTVGERMGIEPEEYVSAVERHFPRHMVDYFTVANEHFVPMRGTELFIGAAKSWKEPLRFVAWSEPQAPASDFVLSEAGHVGFARAPARVNGVRFPEQIAERIDVDYPLDPRAAIVGKGRSARLLFPLEIAAILGIDPNSMTGTDEETAYHLLGESVAVPVAERAIRSLLRAAGLE